MHKLKLLPDNRTLDAKDGESVFAACRRAGVFIQSSCGGAGTCGKCIVRVSDDHVPAHGPSVRGLTADETARGFRLACHVRIQADLVVEIPAGSRSFGEQILTATGKPLGRAHLHPNVKAHAVALARPSLDDQASDLDRLARALNEDSVHLEAGLEQLRELSAATHAGGFTVTATFCGKRLVRTEPGDARGRVCGLAFDIGTTTVVGYLMDLQAGLDLALASRANPQAAYGQDVLSRSDHAHKGPAELQELQRLIAGCLQEIAEECSAKAKVPLDRCYEATVAGNTIMTHLALGVDPFHITHVPFTPVWTKALSAPAAELGLRLHPAAWVYAAPCVAGYVGGDITAGLIATELEKREKPTLFVDIGTNGEVVLGDRTRIIACASPAGPAFEGARISCGSRAMLGALDKVSFDDATGDLAFHAIGGETPRGVCGTGLIDAVAAFLQRGLLAPDGLLLEPDEARAKLPPKLAARVRKGPHGSEVLLVPAEQTLEGRRPLTLTQRDMRELQLAKGALRAGVDMALKLWGLTGAQLDRVLIAGGFGNFINPASALATGLFPPDVKLEQLEFVGNTAAAGAKLCLADTRQREHIQRLARQVEYVELSGRPDFQDVFMDAMLFPGEE